MKDKHWIFNVITSIETTTSQLKTSQSDISIKEKPFFIRYHYLANAPKISVRELMSQAIPSIWYGEKNEIIYVKKETKIFMTKI